MFGTSSSSSSSSSSSTYLILTFYGKDFLILNTNATGRSKNEVVKLISTYLPSLVQSHAVGVPQELAVVFHGRANPFGTRASSQQRQVVCVQLCLLLEALQKVGWSCFGDSNLDSPKRRGSIIMRLDHSTPVNICCASVLPNRYLQLSLPQDIEARVIKSLQSRVKPGALTLEPISWQEGRKVFKTCSDSQIAMVAQIFRILGYSIKSDNYKRSIGLVIELIKALNDYGYELITCVSVFGDQQDVMFFRKTNLRLPLSEYWGLTLKNPKQTILVNAPANVRQILLQEVQAESLWNIKCHDFWARRDGSVGKVAFSRLLRRLSLENWRVCAVYDGLSDNSFFLFKEFRPTYPNPTLAFPKILTVSCVSAKKLKIDHSSHTGIPRVRVNPESIHPEEPSEFLDCIKTLQNSRIVTQRRWSDMCTMVFNPKQFSYNSVANVVGQLSIYLFLLLEMESIGYRLYCTGNISGQYLDPNKETDVASPHSWFFIKAPPEHGIDPPAFSEEGLPTYEQAMEQWDLEHGQ
eukprot:TCALIF_08926-PA protein Name:"Protein of unknown function" AED:0.16 eAED:0.21 QI:115/0.6/0.5/1/1/0.83/6/0/520